MTEGKRKSNQSGHQYFYFRQTKGVRALNIQIMKCTNNSLVEVLKMGISNCFLKMKTRSFTITLRKCLSMPHWALQDELDISLLFCKLNVMTCKRHCYTKRCWKLFAKNSITRVNNTASFFTLFTKQDDCPLRSFLAETAS